MIKHQYIYDDLNNPIYAFKRVLVLKYFPGISTRLDFSCGSIISFNNNDIEDEVTAFNDHLVLIRDKNPKFRGMIFYGVIIGKQIINQSFIEDDFVFYVFACYDKNLNKWLEYDELNALVSFNYFNLVKICPMIGNYSTDYNELKSVLTDDIYSILILSYPKIFINTDMTVSVLEYVNPLYQEELIDYSANVESVFKELSSIILEVVSCSFFRTSLAEYCCAFDKKLDNLSINDLSRFKIFILDKINNRKLRFNYQRIDTHPDLFLKMCKLDIRKKYIDFLMLGI